MRSALVAAVLLSGCYHESGSAPPAQNQLVARAPSYAQTIADPLGFLPIDSELVAGIDMRAVRASTLWQLVGPKLFDKRKDQLVVFREHCGFDIVDAMTYVSVGVRDVGSHHPQGVFVVHGFQRTSTLACAHKYLLGVNPRAKLVGEAIVVAGETDPTESMALQFVDEHTFVALMGPNADERALAAVLASRAPLRGSPTFSSLFERVDTHQAAWFVINGNAKLFDGGALGFHPRAVWAWIALRDGIAATLHVQLDSAADAQQLVTTAQGQIGMFKPMVDAIDLAAEDTDLVLTLAIGDQKLQALLGLAGGLITP